MSDGFLVAVKPYIADFSDVYTENYDLTTLENKFLKVRVALTNQSKVITVWYYGNESIIFIQGRTVILKDGRHVVDIQQK